METAEELQMVDISLLFWRAEVVFFLNLHNALMLHTHMHRGTAAGEGLRSIKGTHFTCFTSAKVPILMQELRGASLYQSAPFETPSVPRWRPALLHGDYAGVRVRVCVHVRVCVCVCVCIIYMYVETMQKRLLKSKGGGARGGGVAEPRLHFALSLGCVSSPDVRVYSLDNLDEELDIGECVRACVRACLVGWVGDVYLYIYKTSIILTKSWI